MIAFLTIVSVLQSFSISLGVGSSTLAIINFFAAIADGTIDETERRMMGIVYVVLRIAMAAILVTTLILLSAEYSSVGIMNMTPYAVAQFIVLMMLFLNAMLMTAHLMPSTFGPAIQAGSWYALGTLVALKTVGMTDFSFLQFMLGYIAWIVLAISIVNGVMAILKEKKRNQEQEA